MIFVRSIRVEIKNKNVVSIMFNYKILVFENGERNDYYTQTNGREVLKNTSYS